MRSLILLIACCALGASNPSLRAGDQVNDDNSWTPPAIWPPMSGINVAVDIKGLNKLVKEILPTFLETIETMAIPNIEHQEAKIPLGHIFVDVTDIDIGNVQIPAVTLDTQEPNIVGFSSTGMNIPVHANWHYVGMGWPHIADSGSVDVTAQDGTAACQLKITEVNHRPNATMLSDTIGFSDYHISVHGGHSWLYNIISDIFHRAIKGALNTALSKALTSALGDQLNTFFQGIPISYTLKTPEIENLELRLNASLLATTMSAFGAHTGSQTVTLTDKMEFYAPKWRKTPNCAVGDPYLPNWWVSGVAGREVQLYIAGEVINCALWVANQEKAFSLKVTQSQFPEGTKIFHTNWWEIIAPGLVQKWNGYMMVMELRDYDSIEQSYNRPVFTINAEGLHCSCLGSVKFSVIDGDSTPWVMILEVEVDAGLDIIIHQDPTTKESTIVLQIDEMKVNFTGKYETTVGDLAVGDLEFVSSVILPLARVLINGVISGGLPIPILTGFGLENPHIAYSNSTSGADFFAIGADIVYNA